MNLEDRQLARAIRGGSTKAFEQFFRKYHKKLVRFAYTYVHSVPVAEDLVQESFLKVWERRTSLDPEDSVRAYLYQAVRNGALDYKKHQEVEQKNLPRFRHLQDTSTVIEVALKEDKAFVEAVHQAIDNLPDRARQVYQLSRTDGLTYKEIAEVMGISVKTVESQMSRSLKILRKSLIDFLPVLLIVELIYRIVV